MWSLAQRRWLVGNPLRQGSKILYSSFSLMRVSVRKSWIVKTWADALVQTFWSPIWIWKFLNDYDPNCRIIAHVLRARVFCSCSIYPCYLACTYKRFTTICLVDEAGKYSPFFPGHIFFSNGTKGWDMISTLNPASETRLRACFGLP